MNRIYKVIMLHVLEVDIAPYSSRWLSLFYGAVDALLASRIMVKRVICDVMPDYDNHYNDLYLSTLSAILFLLLWYSQWKQFITLLCPSTHLVSSSKWTWIRSCVRFEVFAAVTMKNAVFCDIKILFLPHRKQYVSVTVFSLLILCKIWECQCGDYKECCLLGCNDVWLL
jgi:hypothetical protein